MEGQKACVQIMSHCDRGSKRAFSDCVLGTPFILKSKQMLAKYMPGMCNGNVEIRIASSSGHPQLRSSPLDLFALFTESNLFYEAMSYPPGGGNPDSRLSTVTFPRHLNMTDITSPKSQESVKYMWNDLMRSGLLPYV